jgi:predicted component of type VI protein secretion system
MKAELVPLDGEPPIPITRDVTVVGRRDSCDIVIPDPSLSKQHCVIVRTDGLLMIRDLATTNGTKVNGQRISWAALLPNDRLTLGRVKLRVFLGGDHQISPSEQFAKQQRVKWSPHPARGDGDSAPQNAPVVPNHPPREMFAQPSPPEGLPEIGLSPQPSPADRKSPDKPIPQAPEPGPLSNFPIAPGDSDDDIFQIDLDLDL